MSDKISQVILCASVPLDRGYTHTIYFSTSENQIGYFISKKLRDINSLSIIKYEDGYCYIQVPYSDARKCNYICMKNGGIDNKWVYAFIDKVEYVNDNNTKIYFTLDVMQTYHFNYTINMCFVEREHTSTDNIGDNTIEENIDIGEYVSMGALYSDVIVPELCIVVATSFGDNGEWAKGGIYNGVYQGIHQYAFQLSDVDALNDFIFRIIDAGKGDGILSIYMMPKIFFSNTGFPQVFETQKNYSELTDGYIPKNKKLLTYPYNMLLVTNGTGISAEYKYELFTGDTCKFEYFGDASLDPSMMLYPISYAGQLKNYNAGITVRGYPQCAFTTDAYRAWLAQNSTSLGIQALSTTGAIVAGVATSNPVLITGGAIGVAQLIGNSMQKESVPPQYKGNSGNGVLDVSLDIKGFLINKMSLRVEKLKIIDDYFTMFGYACKRIKTPNRNVRPKYTYCKTVDCTITGTVPGDHEKIICDVYNKGITFWKNGSEVGNYSVDNRV